MKLSILLSLLFTQIVSAQIVPTRNPKPWCPSGSKLSTIGGDEPYCLPTHKLTMVPGRNIPEGMGCFACIRDPRAKVPMQLQNQ